MRIEELRKVYGWRTQEKCMDVEYMDKMSLGGRDHWLRCLSMDSPTRA